MIDPRNYTYYSIKAANCGFIIHRNWFVDKNLESKEEKRWERERGEDIVFTAWDDVVKYLADNKVAQEPTE